MSPSYIFAGNRAFVLEELLNSPLRPVNLFAVKGSYLERFLESRNLPYELLPSKTEFVKFLKSTDFDFFIANGLPIILPVSKIVGQSSKKMINVHPSYLPDLRGADPVPGALLHGRNLGATCHYMDDGIDTGTIIAQELIPYSECLDAGLLYQLSFHAEKKVVKKALERNFEPLMQQAPDGNEIYYTFKEQDLLIDFNEPSEKIIGKIKAFNTQSKGAYFMYGSEKFRVFDVEVVRNEFVKRLFSNIKDGSVALIYENKILLKKEDCFLKLKQIDKDVNTIKIGYNLKWTDSNV